MRLVEYKLRAVNAIEAVCDFIESKNVPGSSVKWYSALLQFIDRQAQIKKIQFPLCNYHKFAAKGFSCFVFKKEWIVVFKYSHEKLIVYRFVNGSRLK